MVAREKDEELRKGQTKQYSTEGLDSRSDVQQALKDASYTPSQNVTDAATALKEWQDARPEGYQSNYQSRIDALLEQLLERETFRYDHEKDPLYSQYEQVYSQNAHNASADAAAQAAALTGGYGSSYAVSAAQQAYQQQIGALNNIVPTLYGLALDTYNSGGDEMLARLEQLAAQEENAQSLYEQQLADYYTQLAQKGEAYNKAYEQDYGEYQDHLKRLDDLYGYYAAQEQQQATEKQQRFNNAMTIFGVLGDALQLALSGTTGLGSLAGSLMNTGYNIYADKRDYEAQREDAQWNRQMQESQLAASQAQQKYENEASEREYQDALAQQKFNNKVTSEKLEIAKGEWALKQAQAQSRVSQEEETVTAKTAAGSTGTSGGMKTATAQQSQTAVASGKLEVPYTALVMRSQGKSDVAIRSALMQEGYTAAQVAKILGKLKE